MRRIAALAALVASFTLLGGSAHADLKRGRAKFLQGDYKTAITELAKTSGKDKASAQLLLGQVHARVGDYAKAEAVARSLLTSKDASLSLEGAVLLARVMRDTGRYAEALKTIEPVATANPKDIAAQAQLALAYRDLGQGAKARGVWEASFMHPFDQNGYDTTDATRLYYLAQAARYYGEYDLANDAYREAVSLDASFLQANIEWGHLFLDKYAAGDAETSFDEVLKLDPHHPDAHAGMALVKLEQSYDLKAANHHVDQALAVNPRHVPSLLVRASMEIDQNQWTAARATLAEALKVNPMSFEARARLATIHWLRDDTRAYQAEKKRVFAANPEYAEFFHIIANSAVREHRYKEAIDLEKEAVAIDKDYFEAMQAIGTGYLRLGDDKQGVEWLEKSWKGDSYNVRTKNMLDLFDDVIPKSYGFTTTKYFKFRYHNDEQKILHRYVAPVMDKAFEDMVKRYGFKPQTPVSIELFQSSEHYSVRTVGLPNLGALGVCFGQVITAISPSVGDINWSMVLWHELAHVFAIQMSNSRVPRWFTEGLSEYETIIARPEWRRENDADIWAAMEDGTLPSVAELNYGFMKPSMQEVVVAYHLSSVTIEYIANTYGFPKIVEALKLFGQGKETPEVIKQITGLDVKAFDARFRKHLEKRLAAYKGTFRPPTAGMDDLKQLEIDAAAKPKDATTQARLALGQFYDGNAPAAKAAAAVALGLDPKNKVALYVSAEIALRMRNTDEAKKRYLELIAVGGDSFDVRSRLGMIARTDNDIPGAEKQLQRAKKLDPERSYPYMELAEIYEGAGRTDEALKELETYVMIEQMQFGPLQKLIDGYRLKKNWAKVIKYGEMALNIDPFNAELHLDLGAAQVESGDTDAAIFSLHSALIARPELRRPALAHIALARAYSTKNNKRAAKKALKLALKYEPTNAEALALKKTIK